LKEGANRFKAHWLFRLYSTGFVPSNRTSPGLGYSRLMWEVTICSLSSIGSGVQEARSVARINARRSQALALGRVETSLCHLRRWSKFSGGVSFAQAEKSTATMPLMSAIVKCGPQTNSTTSPYRSTSVPAAARSAAHSDPVPSAGKSIANSISGQRRALRGSRISETRETTEGSAELKFRIPFPPAESHANQIHPDRSRRPTV